MLGTAINLYPHVFTRRAKFIFSSAINVVSNARNKSPTCKQSCDLLLTVYIYIYIYKGVSKSSRTVLVKRSLLTLDAKFLHHLQSTPLLHEYSGPSVSAILGSIHGSPFLELCQVPAAISLESLQWCRIFDPSSESSG